MMEDSAVAADMAEAEAEATAVAWLVVWEAVDVRSSSPTFVLTSSTAMVLSNQTTASLPSRMARSQGSIPPSR